MLRGSFLRCEQGPPFRLHIRHIPVDAFASIKLIEANFNLGSEFRKPCLVQLIARAQFGECVGPCLASVT